MEKGWFSDFPIKMLKRWGKSAIYLLQIGGIQKV
jgi:hypothetical protein